MEKYVTYRELVNKFITFLKKENAYKEYLEAFRNAHRLSCHENWYTAINPLAYTKIRNRIDKGYIKDIIDYSFCWDKTKQGHYFWRKLNRKWNDIISIEIEQDYL